MTASPRISRSLHGTRRLPVSKKSDMKQEILSADRRAVNLLLTVPFHAVLETASLSALREAYLRSAKSPKAGSRRAAISEKLEALMSLALPASSHD